MAYNIPPRTLENMEPGGTCRGSSHLGKQCHGIIHHRRKIIAMESFRKIILDIGDTLEDKLWILAKNSMCQKSACQSQVSERVECWLQSIQEYVKIPSKRQGIFESAVSKRTRCKVSVFTKRPDTRRCEGLENERHMLRKRIEHAEVQLKATQQALETTRQALKQEEQKSQQQIEQLKSEQASATKESEELRQRVARLKSEGKILRESYETNQTLLKAAQDSRSEERQAWNHDKQKLKEHVNYLKSERKALAEEHNALEQKLQRLLADKKTFQNRLEGLKSQLEQERRSNLSHSQKQQEQEQHIAFLMAEGRKLDQQVDRLMKERATMIAERERLQEKVDKLNTMPFEKQTLLRDKRALEDHIGKLMSEGTALLQERDVLRHRVYYITKEGYAVQVRLEEANSTLSTARSIWGLEKQHLEQQIQTFVSERNILQESQGKLQKENFGLWEIIDQAMCEGNALFAEYDSLKQEHQKLKYLKEQLMAGGKWLEQKVNQLMSEGIALMTKFMAEKQRNQLLMEEGTTLANRFYALEQGNRNLMAEGTALSNNYAELQQRYNDVCAQANDEVNRLRCSHQQLCNQLLEQQSQIRSLNQHVPPQWRVDISSISIDDLCLRMSGVEYGEIM